MVSPKHMCIYTILNGLSKLYVCIYILVVIKEGHEFERAALGELEVGRGGGNDINAVVVYEILKTPKR